MGFFDTIDRLKNAETGLQPEEISINVIQGGKKNDQSRVCQLEKKAGHRPERLSFLRPCPLCGGKKFVYGNAGGFFCLLCQPGIMGTPVEAGGADRQQKPDHPESAHQVAARANKNTTIWKSGHFKTAWPWIRSRLPELLAAGWTLAALFQRSKYSYPYAWGIAWFPIWNKDALVVTTGKNGEIFFTFQSSGRTITQTVRPPKKKHKPGNRNKKKCQ